MQKIFHGHGFRFDSKESEVERNLLWESHCHSRFEMIGVLEGDITVMFEGRHYRLGENQYAVVPPLSYHTVTANRRGKYRRVTVLFDGEAIPEVLRPKFSEPSTIFIGRSHQIPRLNDLCREENSDFYAPLAQSIMIQLLYQLIREENAPSAARVDDSLARMLEYIDNHLWEKIRLEDIAVHSACSKSSVSHLFEEKMKISPKQYILQKKLALAETLLRDGVPATETALRVGYENYSNFYRMYRKYFGTAPSEKPSPKT